MVASHAEGRHPGWAHINSDPNRKSFPEKFVKTVLENNKVFEDFTVIQHFPIGKYFLDFAIIELNINIEVDGEQHFRTDAAIEHDRIRNEFMISSGWKVYRIRWAKMCRDSIEEIARLIDFIRIQQIDN
jgi:very-short-patch-repair endonuclease